MIHRLFSRITTSGIYHLTGRDVSHLIFTGPRADIGKAFVTIQLEHTGVGSDAKTETLCNRIPLTALEGISDVEAGSSLGLRALLAAMDVQIVVGGGAATPMQGHTAFQLDLGNVVLTGTDRLEVQIDATSTMTGLSCYALDMEAGQERIFKYELTADSSKAVVDPISMYAYRTSAKTGGEIYDDDLSIEVILENGQSFLADVEGYWAATAAIGEVEAQAPDRVFIVYQDKWGFPLHGNLAYNATGADLSSYNFIVKSEIMDQDRGSKKTLELAQRMHRKIQQVESSRPAKAKLLRHRNLMPKAEHLGTALKPVVLAQARATSSPGGVDR